MERSGKSTDEARMKRSRLPYLLCFLGVIVLGLASRRYADRLPSWLAQNAGDALWALMVFVGVGMLFPRWPTARTGAAALAFAWLIEVSQLYHAPWIEDIRGTRLGGLILGFGFLWSDLLCYAVGVFAGVLLETGYRACRRGRGPTLGR
jgi:hypothetical protein